MSRTTRVFAILICTLVLSACAERTEAWFPWSYQTSSSSVSESSRPRMKLFPRIRRSSSSISSVTTSPISNLQSPNPEVPIPILVYHHIRPQQGWAKTTWSWKMTVSPEVFEKQMQWIKNHGYTTISLDEYLAIRSGEAGSPEKPIVITFDDNQLSQYDVALPILEKHGFTATFYLITKYLDTPSMIDRNRALDLVNRGMDVQSHTLTHPVLTALPIDQIDWQLKESKRLLEELTGKPVHHIAYPGTAHNATVRERTKLAGYTTGTIMDPRWTKAGDDPFKLPRIMMTDDTDLMRVLP